MHFIVHIFPGVEPEPFVLGEHLVEASGKLVLIDQLLGYLQPRGHKVLLFSQMTRMLDIIQDYLGYRGQRSISNRWGFVEVMRSWCVRNEGSGWCFGALHIVESVTWTNHCVGCTIYWPEHPILSYMTDTCMCSMFIKMEGGIPGTMVALDCWLTGRAIDPAPGA